MAVDAGVRIADEALARVVARDPAGALSSRRPCGGRGSGRASPRSARRSARGSSARRARPRSGRRSAASSTRALKPRHELVVDRLVDDHRAERGAALARRAEAAEQRALDREVESRRPASRPAGSCRRARGRPTARCGRRARRSREPTADDPVKPTLSTSLSSSARSRPSKAVGPSRLHEVQDAVGQAARDEQARERVAERGRVLRGLPDDGVAAQDRRARGTRTARPPGSCRP